MCVNPLEVIDSTVHGFTSSDVFIREDGAAEPTFKSNSLTLTANHVSRQTLQLPFLVLGEQFGSYGRVIDEHLSYAKVTIRFIIAVDKLRMIVNVDARNNLPGW